MRFSLKWLLVAMAFVAVSLVALLNANGPWRHGFETLVLLLFLTAVVGTTFSTGLKRAFWTGCAVFGGVWLLLVVSSFEFANAWEVRLVTTDGFNALHGILVSPTNEVFPKTQIQQMEERRDNLANIAVTRTTLPDGRYQLTYLRPSQSMFTAVGNAILCIPFGLLGGAIARAFYRRRLCHPSTGRNG